MTTEPRPTPPSLIEETKRYVGFSNEDARTLVEIALVVEPHLPALSERFYAELRRHPRAMAVLTGGSRQAERLKLTLQEWARGLFRGDYGARYADERSRIGSRHVRLGVPQPYVIEAMAVVAEFLHEVLRRNLPEESRCDRAAAAMRRILAVDLTLMCDTYLEDSLQSIRDLQRELEARNRALETANQALVQALAVTSHELRTPLTAVVGFSQLLAEDRVVEPARRREFVAEISANARSMLELVDQLLDVARIEAGTLEVIPAEIDLRAVVTETTGMLTVHAEEKALRLDVRVLVHVPPVVADEKRLRQVLVNLIGNAIKFTDRGGVFVTVDVEPELARAVVQIRDTGVGVPVDKQALVFEKFQQARTETGRRRGGLGLGLTLSKWLVERMGGTIALRSAGEHEGTTVAFTLRLADASEPLPFDRACADVDEHEGAALAGSGAAGRWRRAG